jgi:hypothetical protein
MDEQQQRDDLVRMQEGMRHVISTVDEIKRTMATQKDLELLANKAEVGALAVRIDQTEKQIHQIRIDAETACKSLREEIDKKSPGAMWRTVTGFASGLVVLIAAGAMLINWAKGLP